MSDYSEMLERAKRYRRSTSSQVLWTFLLLMALSFVAHAVTVIWESSGFEFTEEN